MLILATVTIGAINGGLFEYAGKAKKEVEKTEEVQAIQQAIIIAKGNSKTGRLEKQELKKQLNKNGYEVDIMQNANNLIIYLKEKDRFYEATNSGEVKKMDIIEKDVKVADRFKTEEYTWQDIHEIAKTISSNFSADESGINKTTNDVKIIYNKKIVELTVGDEFILKDTFNNSYKVRILGFNTDKLAEESNVVGNTTYKGTYAGISFEFVDFLKYDGTNSDAPITPATEEETEITSEGGWAETQIRKILNGNEEENIVGAVENLENKEYIKTVKKEYNVGNRLVVNSTCNDKLWLLACSEIWADDNNNGRYGTSLTNESTMTNGIEETRYKYYANGNPLESTQTDYVKKYVNKSSKNWWLRSPDWYSIKDWSWVRYTGICYEYFITSNGNIAPGFCI